MKTLLRGIRNATKACLIGSAFVYSERGQGSTTPKPPADLTVYTTDPSHPIMAGVPESFTLKEEFFQLMRPAQHGDVGHEIAAAEDPRETEREPVAFVLNRGNGRVFHLYLGHFVETHHDAHYRRILVQGVKWAAGNFDSKEIQRVSNLS